MAHLVDIVNMCKLLLCFYDDMYRKMGNGRHLAVLLSFLLNGRLVVFCTYYGVYGLI